MSGTGCEGDWCVDRIFFERERERSGDVVLCGLVFLYGGEVDGRWGSPAPLLKLPVLKEEVYGREGDAGLSRRLAKRPRHRPFGVTEMATLL